MSFRKYKGSKKSLPYAKILGKEVKSSLEAWECQQPKDIYFLAKDRNGFAYVCLERTDAKKLANYILGICRPPRTSKGQNE